MDDDPLAQIRKGNVDYFKQVPLDVLSSFRDERGNSLLASAVLKKNLNCAKVIYGRCPSLLYSETTEHRYNVLTHITYYMDEETDDLEILKFLIEADAESQRRGANKRLTRMMDTYGHAGLMVAVKYNKPKSVKLLYAADPDFHHPPNKGDLTPLRMCMSDPSKQEMFKLLLEIAPVQSKTPMGPDGWTVLHYAASNGELSALKDILRYCPDCSEVVDNKGQNFLHIAARHEQVEVVRFCIVEKKDIASTILNGLDNNGNTPWYWAVRKLNMEIIKILTDANLDSFKAIDKDALWSSIDEGGESFLSKAVQGNYFDLCKMICSKCPSLVYHQSRDGKTPLHHAAWRGDAKMVNLLLSAGAKSKLENKGDIESQVDTNNNTKLVMMVDELGDTALHIAVSKHKLEAVKHLIEADCDVAYNANKAGETPLSIAIREARSNQDRLNTGKIRKLLLKMQPSQSIAPIAENGWTLLHFSASYDDVNAVMEIIEFCPDYIELVDNEGMNFIHVAAKSKSIQVVKRVLASQKIPDSVLNMKDNNGNTPLHIAALSDNVSLTLCFLYDRNVDKTTVNNDGQHVLKAINFDYDKRKAGVRGVTDQLDQKGLKDQSDFDLVVGALIATVSFTAGVTVPGGYISDGPNKGTAVLSKEMAFEVFVISNTFALLFSLYAVFSHYCTRRLIDTQDILYQLKVATYCTLGALYAMMAAFISGSFAVLANSTRLAIPVCAIGCCFYIFSIRPMWKIAMQERGGSRWAAALNGGRILKFGGRCERLDRATKNPPLFSDNL